MVDDVFDSFDMGGDGSISYQELNKIIRTPKSKTVKESTADAKSNWGKAKLEGDRQSGRRATIAGVAASAKKEASAASVANAARKMSVRPGAAGPSSERPGSGSASLKDAMSSLKGLKE